MAQVNEKPLDGETIESYSWRPVAKLGRSAARTKSLRDRYHNVRDNLFDALSKADMESLGKTAKETLITLAELQDEARRIDRQRRDAAREIGIHVGASEKMEEKYNGKFVRKPLAKFAKKQNAKTRQKLLNALAAGEEFNDRASLLKSQRMVATTLKHYMRGIRDELKADRNAAVILAELSEVAAESARNVEKVIDQSQQEWKKTLKAAGRGKAGPQA